MADLKGKTVFITGASRGIGRAIALRAAADGASVVLTAKSDVPHPKLPGTIHTVAEEVEAAGGRALPLKLDVREEHMIAECVGEAAATFGGIDVLVNNAGAISLTGTAETPVKRFDLMMAINVRAAFACTQACLPHLEKASNPHVLTLSPPINLNPRWLAGHAAYTISKYGMTMLTIGMAEEFRDRGIAVNSLWPRTTIATAAIEFVVGAEMMAKSRKPEIMADAAYAIVTGDSRTMTGNILIDEDVLGRAGITDFDRYALSPGGPLQPDLFLDE